MVAIHHTHPAPAEPSGTDLYYMHTNRCLWLISTTSKPAEPKGYYLTKDEELKQIMIEIIAENLPSTK